ncbi:SphA family protein [Acidocella facilis]|uniref:SphA family protein n=1 Tax=Acidocella facilis TaxID=525 RepID=UPI001F16A992|nr:transporter [Acidocella facilis]
MQKKLEKICTCLMIAGILDISVSTRSSAIEKGTLPDYPPGFTIGMPSGALPGQGIFWSEKAFYDSVQAVDGTGADTGTHINAFATTGNVIFVPGWKILGANYAFQADDFGAFHETVHFPDEEKRNSFSVTGGSDLELFPVVLSWKLPSHFFASIREGVYLPTGQFNSSYPANIGHDRWAFEQGAALSYVSIHYIFSANSWTDVNGATRSAVVDHYKSGSTFDVDLSALKIFGKFETGPVGYYYRQFGGDSGPESLDGGMPQEDAIGWLAGYNFGRYSANIYVTQDVYTRDVGRQSKIWLTFNFKI